MNATLSWSTIARNLFFCVIIVPIMAASLIIDVRPSLHPLKNETAVTSGFGQRINPFSKEKQLHKGIDLKAAEGTPVYATADARVDKAEQHEKKGLFIELQHGEAYMTAYNHLSKLEVKAGQQVRAGDLIGLVGNTGLSSAPHLHYEVYFEGEPVNPVDYLPED